MTVKLISLSLPVSEETQDLSAEEFIVYVARVSNPSNQLNMETAPRLIKYLIDNKHWSPFEMATVVMEVTTTRDIGRQILRHRSFSFQEFSQRYATAPGNFVSREPRLQDNKNRQNSIINTNKDITDRWNDIQAEVFELTRRRYEEALAMGIAKEQARALLPEGLTSSVLYMSGTLRSWIHYCQLRCGNGTQKDHRDIAVQCRDILVEEFPSLSYVFENN